MEPSSAGAPQETPPPNYVPLDGRERDPRIGAARAWLVAVAILTLIGGLVFWAIGKDRVEKDIRTVELELVNVDHETRDQMFLRETGMTWEQVKAHDRRAVTIGLFIHIGLALAYFALFFWAKRKALAATVTALLLFVGVHAADALYDPAALTRGILLKVLFVVALVKGILAALDERRRQAHVPRASLV